MILTVHLTDEQLGPESALWRQMWLWLQLQGEREFADLIETTQIPYTPAGHDLVTRHAQRISEPFEPYLGPAEEPHARS